MTSDDRDLAALEQRIATAIRSHRLVIESTPDDAVAVMATINELHLSMQTYANRVLEVSGWGNPFVGLDDTEGDVGDDSEDDIPADAVDDEKCENKD